MFQKRLDGSVDFYRSWADYKRGFGNLNGEFWLGLDKIHRLTKSNNRLRVDLEDTTGKTAYAEYDMFAVTSERTKYQLSLGTYSGELTINRPPPPPQKKKIAFSVLLLSFRKSIKIKNSLCLPIW